MPFNGSNSFSIVDTFVPGTTILSSAVNANFSDIATGLSDCVTRDAQGPVTGNLVYSSTGFIGLPTGTTVQRPGSALAGYTRFNTTNAALETFDGTQWDSLGANIGQPQGYITPTSGTPIITGDVTAATSLFYTPYTGQLCPVFNGTAFTNQVFSEQTLTLVSNHLASTIYDVFAFVNGTTFTIATGPAWSNSAAGSGSRGTGAGSTQLQRINGLLTNQNSMTARNGATTYTVAANQGTYLGSILIDGSAGQVSFHRSFGQSRKWGAWNAFNRRNIMLQCGDSTANWSYNSATIRQSHGAAGNQILAFTGLAEEEVICTFTQLAFSNAGSLTYGIGIGYNTTTATSGTNGSNTISNNTAPITFGNTLEAVYTAVPALGLNNINCVEFSGTPGNTFSGTQGNMVLEAIYQG